MKDIGRREILAGAGALAGGAILLGSASDRLIAPGDDRRDARLETYRPVPGGVAITVDGLDGYGSLGGAIEDGEGDRFCVTNRHVVDPGFPDSDDDDVLGTTVYQPDGSPIGDVEDVGPAKGSGATDWATIALEDDVELTGTVLGLEDVGDAGDESVGDRVILSGLKTGIVGAEITATGVSRNWKGTILDDVIEYRVDGEIETEGNSGCYVGTIEADEFRPIGLHTFREDGYRYAVPIDDVLEDADVDGSIYTEGEAPSLEADDVDPYLEGAIVDEDLDEDGNEVWQTIVANIGGEAIDDREVSILEAGDVVDSTTVSLDPLEAQTITLDAGDELDTGDETTSLVEI